MSPGLFDSFISLFFPERCIHCGKPLNKNEHYICSTCRSDLPYTHFAKFNDNLLTRSFWGRIPVQTAYSYLHYYKHSAVQQILYKIKYQNSPELASYFGEEFGHKLLQLNYHKVGIDIFLPVPLHPHKQKIRGYNQSEQLAIGLSKVLDKPIETKAIIRSVFTKTQTKLSGHQRWQNVKGIFKIITPKKLENKHVAIIDDVLTTGATIESLTQTLLRIRNIRISILTLATAKTII